VGKIENARRFVVVDGNVERFYSAEIRNYFEYHGIDTKLSPFPAERRISPWKITSPFWAIGFFSDPS